MKIISFAIPCYNSEGYMSHCIDTLLAGKEEVEIIIINDGSKDDTLKIAKSYQKKYPNIIKVIDKENGGHGSGVNVGLENATGYYYKVVDSDDWVNVASLKEVLAQMKKLIHEKKAVDLFITNYVYERENEQRIVQYKNIPENKIITWQDIKKFKISQYLLMHSVFYRTDFLKKTKIKLPEHTFYVDNIFVYYPLPKVKTMYYLNTNFYRYFIGREDQSVNERVMIGRIDQQLFITKKMIEFGNPLKYKKIQKELCTYQLHYLAIMMTICTILLKIDNTMENKTKLKNIWYFLKSYDRDLYNQIRYRSLAFFSCLPRIIAVPGYHIARKIYKFN